MQRLEALWKLVSVAAAVRDVALESRRLEFVAAAGSTFYLHAEHARVTVARWPQRRILLEAALQAGFGWRMQAEQDEAGVYVVAKRRTLVGNLSRAQFRVLLPDDVYAVLKLAAGSLELEDVEGTLHLPPAAAGPLTLRAAAE